MVYDDGTAHFMGRVVLYSCAMMVYLILDLSFKGLVWLFYDTIIVPWVEDIFPKYDYTTYNKKVNETTPLNKRKDDGVVYCGNGYTTARLNDVWVESYIDKNDLSKGFTSKKEVFFNGAALGYEWRWLSNMDLYGWRQKPPAAPPPKPTIIVSEGIKDQVEEYLKGYRANEINKRLARLPQKGTKTPDPAEKAPIQQQNPQT